jgi:hypothetical protein
VNDNQRKVKQIIALTESMRVLFVDCRLANFEMGKIKSAIDRLAESIQPEVKAVKLEEVKSA